MTLMKALSIYYIDTPLQLAALRFIYVDVIPIYNIILVDTNGVSMSFTSNTESIVVNSLRCCSSYSYRVSVTTSNGGEGALSQAFTFMTEGQYDGK